MEKTTFFPPPDRFRFETRIRVDIHFINYGGHVGNSAYLDIAHEARLQFLKSIGASEKDFGGKGLIMTKAVIEFKRESFYGDCIRIKIATELISRFAFHIFYLLEKEENDLTQTIARMRTEMACFDYDKKKIAPIPPEMAERLNNKNTTIEK